MHIYLVRHGQTSWNASQKCQGHTDIPLDESGTEQASRLVQVFDSLPLKRILTSDLSRAIETAQPVAAHHNIQIEARFDLRERSFGDWEGAAFEDLGRFFVEESLKTGSAATELRPPNGESLADVWARIERVTEEIHAEHEPILVVTHGGTCSLLLAKLIGSTLESSRAFRFSNTGISTLARRPDVGLHLQKYNDTSHLRERALVGSVEGPHR